MTRITAAEFRKLIGKKETARLYPKRKSKPKPVPTLATIRIRAELNGYKVPYRVMEDPPHNRAFFFLPIELCKPQNRKRAEQAWQGKSDRVKLFRFMQQQCVKWAEPLPGRPLVRCIRYSSVEPDRFSDWAKGAVDCLCRETKRAKERLGIIYDDAPKYAEIEQIWRKAKPGGGFVVIEVWEGVE